MKRCNTTDWALLYGFVVPLFKGLRARFKPRFWLKQGRRLSFSACTRLLLGSGLLLSAGLLSQTAHAAAVEPTASVSVVVEVEALPIKALVNRPRHLTPVLLSEASPPPRLSKQVVSEIVVSAYAQQHNEQLHMLKLDPVVFNGKQAYRVKALSQDSRVRIVYVDAFTGQLLN